MHHEIEADSCEPAGSRVDWLPESLLLRLLQFLLRRVVPAKPRIDFKRGVQREGASMLYKVAGGKEVVDGNGFLLAPGVIIYPVIHSKNILRPRQLTPCDLVKLEGDCHPTVENLAIRHTSNELEYGCGCI